jgi:creatinine amidohydrolase/Fe(II)-dependent formamide hydrolase-like protein
MDVAAARAPGAAADGVSGDPRRASPGLGQLGVDLVVDASVAAIRARTVAPR